MDQRLLDKLPNKPNLRPVEIAAFLDVSVVTVYQMIKQGVIPALRTSPRAHGHYRIPRDKFLKAIESGLVVQPDF